MFLYMLHTRHTIITRGKMLNSNVMSVYIPLQSPLNPSVFAIVTYASTTPLYRDFSPIFFISACMRTFTTSVGCAESIASVPVVIPAAIRTNRNPIPESPVNKIIQSINEHLRYLMMIHFLSPYQAKSLLKSANQCIYNRLTICFLFIIISDGFIRSNANR